jgi:uncharacterized protein DUF4349
MGNRFLLGIVGLVMLSGVVGAACSRSHNSTTAPQASAAGALPSPAQKGVQARTSSGGNAAPGSGIPLIGPRVVKTAALELRVKDGSFDQRFQEATQIASRFGGFVASSATATGKRRSGTLVIRIPVTQFESALGALSDLGTVGSRRVTGQDVTAQFVDLEARLKNWQAQEAVLLNLMAKANSIADSIRVQQNLQDVQLNIEEIKGQLRVLSDQADFSTINVSVAEAGFVAPEPARGSVLQRAWHQAVEGFLGVIAAVVVGLGYVLPLSILAGLLWLVMRRARPKVLPPVESPQAG